MHISLHDLEQALKRRWIGSSLRVPAEDVRGPHYPVHVWGVVTEYPNHRRIIGGLVDIVAYWPAQKVWTVTHSNRADQGAADVIVRVACWQPLPPLPDNIDAYL